MKLQDLYKKVEDFEKSTPEKINELSHCKRGCSKCCYVDLSVFTIEANNIKNWFESLSSIDKVELLKRLNTIRNSTLNFHGKETKSCVFLKNDECTIYPVRPLICRTQGMAIMFKEVSKSFVDICPLNKNILNEIDPNNILNLDTLNHILSRLQLHYENNSDRISLEDLSKQLTHQ